MSHSEAQRLEALEIKISFQEELIDALNQQVSQQQLQMLELERQLSALKQLVRHMQSGGGEGASLNTEEVPPHY